MRRRAVAALALVAAGAAAGCSAAVAQTKHPHAREQRAVKPPANRAQPPDHRIRPVAATAPRPAGSYRVAATESFPAAKRLAEQVALALTTYSPGTSAAQVVAAATDDPARRSVLAAVAAPLFHAGATSRSTVVYPQMGGATADAASVMVVVHQVVTRHGRVVSDQTRTLDIRLVRSGGGWVFDRLASAGGQPVPRPADLSTEAAAVVDNPRISLPDTARWDIYRGSISPTLLRLMSDIAERHAYAVTVLETGHPLDVFGTGHRSMHSYGRAVDINLVAGTHVVDQRKTGSTTSRLVTWLLSRADVTQVGSPWDLDGSGARSFTNAVHLDHVHISV